MQGPGSAIESYGLGGGGTYHSRQSPAVCSSCRWHAPRTTPSRRRCSIAACKRRWIVSHNRRHPPAIVQLRVSGRPPTRSRCASMSWYAPTLRRKFSATNSVCIWATGVISAFARQGWTVPTPFSVSWIHFAWNGALRHVTRPVSCRSLTLQSHAIATHWRPCRVRRPAPTPLALVSRRAVKLVHRRPPAPTTVPAALW